MGVSPYLLKFTICFVGLPTFLGVLPETQALLHGTLLIGTKFLWQVVPVIIVFSAFKIPSLR